YGNVHWIWKDGWPQPGVEENGKGGVEVNGGHEILAVDGGLEQAVVGLVKSGRSIRKRTVTVVVVVVEEEEEEDNCGDGRGISG
ncbi:unnamed protein product, partial [Ilex paraguariensis]